MFFSLSWFTLTACRNSAKIQLEELSLLTRIISIAWSLRVSLWRVNSLVTFSTQIRDTQRYVSYHHSPRIVILHVIISAPYPLHYSHLYLILCFLIGWRSAATGTQPTRTPIPTPQRFPISHLQHRNATLRRTTHPIL